MNSPDFLDLPDRTSRPRSAGLTHVIDGGIGFEAMRDVLATAGASIDIWKFGWGTAYLDPRLPEKLALLREHGIGACTGGTLLEIAWLQDRADAFLDWALEVGFPHVEVSNGASHMPTDEKRRLIGEASRAFHVLAEVGSKDPAAPVSAVDWADEARGDLDAGARLVIAEGRESGTVGLYHPDGRVRVDVPTALVAAVGEQRVLFEAPEKAQQTWFLRKFGPNVNLGNIVVSGVLALESLRLGLRADTIGLHARSGTQQARR